MSETESDSLAEPQLGLEETEALVDFLRTIPLFAELRTADLEALITIAHSEFFAAGSELYRQSEADNTLYILQSGEVSLMHIDPQGSLQHVPAKSLGYF